MKKPQLGATDYLQLLFAASRGLATLTWAASTGWARGDDYPKDYKKHVIYSTTRTMFNYITVEQAQAAGGTTGDAYQDFCKKRKIEPEIVALDEGGHGLMLGPATAKKTVIWFHGGGYNFPATPVHFEFFLRVIKQAKESGEELLVMMLEYELAPHGMYPLQLKQAIAALRHLLNVGVKPSQIIIGGDSAGGNLTAALLGHLSHPKPGLPEVSLSENLGGVLFVSPWITFDQSAPAFTKNYYKDGLGLEALKTWSDNFMGGAQPDNYNTPLDAPADWWKGIKVGDKDIAIIGGSNEVLVDDIREFKNHVKVNNPGLEYLEATDEGHDALVMDRSFGLTGPLESEDFCKKWLLARLK
ncbi:hypothetical protein LTR99_006494 [Exophiala xenobiotica]|uniref:Alpha/beta hydrolase fold-3 domain-containing protein n=1 Tax=Vermiconidia calcicola TaxID=1690605 RepID=A0AAV9Q924_9PEZI|nr:hypothetical protein H2202_003567 [Exophiala xenobiotica]KAK5536983.1 hypothetical protein LTR23_007831 [Chaetothyriales sp. CCFEE 6169]KAK5537664.1 hypothetical protein LTR25_004916 [Vermiconidia calcicola]KAK5258264.1 hypothetical protein LTR40_008239 [Exophiala xenobiotica]KAK5267307.1 hypothetical protein LTR96_007340 [Exophiala xenobiotica]